MLSQPVIPARAGIQSHGRHGRETLDPRLRGDDGERGEGAGKRGENAGRSAGHQKYPSCFFFSMLAAWSWSIARPWRSEVVVSSISRITASNVSASLSTAPVSG